MIHRDEMDGFIRTYQNRFWRYAYFLTRNSDDAKDVLQDALTRIVRIYWDDRMVARSDKERVRYVMATISSEHKNFIRKRSGGKYTQCDLESLPEHSVPVDPDADPGSQIINLTDSQCKEEYLINLSPVQAEVVWLRVVEKYSVKEVATILEMTEANVKSTCSRAVEKIRKSHSARQDLEGERL